MSITRRLLHYLQSLQPGDPVCLHALGSWQEGTISDVSDEDVALIQEDRLLYLPFEAICAYQVPRRDPAALLCEPFVDPKAQPLSVKTALELALAQSDTAFTAEVRAFASRWESATPDQLHDLCASVVNRIAIPFAHLPQAHTLYAAVWREGKPGRDLRAAGDTTPQDDILGKDTDGAHEYLLPLFRQPVEVELDGVAETQPPVIRDVSFSAMWAMFPL